MSVSMQDVMKQSGVAFGTSGARGLVTAMTDRVCYVYARCFIKYCEASYKCEHTIAIAGDLRPSTERILKALVKAGEDSAWKVVYCAGRPQRHQVQPPEGRDFQEGRTGNRLAVGGF